MSGERTSIDIGVECPATSIKLTYSIAAFNELGIGNDYSDEEIVDLSLLCRK